MHADPSGAAEGGGTGTDGDPLVELVDVAGRATGTATRLAAHARPGRLHRAVSVLLLDDAGRMVIQRRALTKYHSAGLWSNACCGHPAPGEPPEACARRRLAAELGLVLPPHDLVPAGVVTYEHADPGSGLVEREYDHLFVGIMRSDPTPDPAEVAAVAAVALAEPRPAELEAVGFTGWYSTVVEAARPALAALQAKIGPVGRAWAGSTTGPPAGGR